MASPYRSSPGSAACASRRWPKRSSSSSTWATSSAGRTRATAVRDWTDGLVVDEQPPEQYPLRVFDLAYLARLHGMTSVQCVDVANPVAQALMAEILARRL